MENKAANEVKLKQLMTTNATNTPTHHSEFYVIMETNIKSSVDYFYLSNSCVAVVSFYNPLDSFQRATFVLLAAL